MMRRSNADVDAPFLDTAFLAHRTNVIAMDGNAMFRGRATVSVRGAAPHARHPFPAVTYTPASELVVLLGGAGGILYAAHLWSSVNFGALDYRNVMRVMIVAATGIVGV